MTPNYQAVVAIMLALTLMLFIVCSAAITITGVGMDDKALGFWQNFLSTLIGGLIGYIAGNKEGQK
jgi:uncharacterized membrane protein YdjX (TVP38/TMEM64 family)